MAQTLGSRVDRSGDRPDLLHLPGQGGKVFAQADGTVMEDDNGAGDGGAMPPKLKIIRAIRSTSLEPVRVMHRHGMPKVLVSVGRTRPTLPGNASCSTAAPGIPLCLADDFPNNASCIRPDMT